MSKREILRKMAKVPIKVAKYAKCETEKEIQKMMKGRDHQEVRKVAAKMLAETKRYTSAMSKIMLTEMKKAAGMAKNKVKKKK